MPVVLSSRDALINFAQDKALLRLRSRGQAWAYEATTINRAHSIAVAIAAWSIAKQFYPFWSSLKVDWDDELKRWVRDCPREQSRQELHRSLERLVTVLDDGHVRLDDARDQLPSTFLPFTLRPLDDGFVVIDSQAKDIRVGDELVSIAGQPTEVLANNARGRISASSQRKAWVVAKEITSGETGRRVKVRVRQGGESREVELAYNTQRLPAARSAREARPETLSEVAPGVRYVDISRFKRDEFEKALPVLGAAKAIIFDLRGYPSGDEASVLTGYWVAAAESATWMKIPIRSRPFSKPDSFQESGWDVQPLPGISSQRKILLTDSRAISHAESLVGYFAAHANGVIVGEPTAGANGNTSLHRLPGEFDFRFTGMVVTTHEGRSVQFEGFKPDLLVRPTLKGIQAGKDEVLDAAVGLALGHT